MEGATHAGRPRLAQAGAPAPARLLRAVRGRPLVALFVLQVTCAIGLATYTASEYRPWSPVDEAGHFGFVQSLAERHRLPLLSDRLSPQVEAFREGRYPAPARAPAAPSWEAFQPPLYYALAVPAYLIAGGFEAKVEAVRYFDVALLGIAALLLYLLARELFPRRWPACLAFAGVVLLWPGIVVRSVTVSNDALAMPVALLFLLLSARAHARPSVGRFALAAAGFGLCLLTKLTLGYLAVVVAAALCAHALRCRSLSAALPAALVTALVLAVMLAPWAAFNERHYRAPTANAAARRMQIPWVDPNKRIASVDAVLAQLPGLALWTLPQEWVKPWLLATTAAVPVPHAASTVRATKLLGAGIEASVLTLAALGVVVYRRRLGPPRTLLLAAPLLAAVLLLAIATLAAQWDLLLSRYLYPAVLPLGLLAGWGLAQAVASARIAVGLAAALTGGTLVMWLSLAEPFL